MTRPLLPGVLFSFLAVAGAFGQDEAGSVAGGGVFANTGANNCSSATPVTVTIGPVSNPAVTTITGNNTNATTPDCTPVPGDPSRPVWWEAFQLGQQATVTIDFCGTTPVQDPSYSVLTRGCGFSGQVCPGILSPNQSGRGSPNCADGNAWATFENLEPGIYRIPIFSDATALQNGRGPYVLHITAKACPGSCCHLNAHTCDDCADPALCTAPGDEFHFGETCVQVECAATIGPDTMVGFVWNCGHLGRVGPIGSGTVAMSCNTTACNQGDMRGDWFALPDVNHPVIGVNLYRSEAVAGATRFEQIGQGWLKHGFGSANDNECDFGCTPGAPFEQIGVGCSDTYIGAQFTSCNLGPRSMIHPYTGAMPQGPAMGFIPGCEQFTTDPTNYPSNDHRDHVHTPISHKVQVQETDLNQTLHLGALYFAEGFYIAPHEFLQGNGNQNNNVTYVRVNVAGPDGSGIYTYSTTGPQGRESPALDAWTGASRTMIEPAPLVDGRAFVAWEVTDLGGGQWHYEYAVYNQNLDRAIGSLCIPLAPGANVTNVGFHAPRNHDPEPHADAYTNTPWTPTITTDAIRWETENFNINPLANAVRFGTLYNFRFDSSLPPQSITGVASLFKTSTLTTVATQGPSPTTPLADVNLDGIPDVCQPPIPANLQADPGITKSRFISFAVPSSQVAGSTQSAIRVKLVSLHHVNPPYGAGPSIPFTSFEGQYRWVGPPAQYNESSSSSTPLYAASLQCTPHYRDWSTIPLLHVTGSAIVPSSTYQVVNMGSGCMGIEETCTGTSIPIQVTTTRWCDIEELFNPPSTTTQPDLADVSALVNKFKSAPGAPTKARALLAGDDAFGNMSTNTLAVDLSFTHIAAAVDAFRGQEYPYAIEACP